jgi:hypothetical protein
LFMCFSAMEIAMVRCLKKCRQAALGQHFQGLRMRHWLS